MSLSSRHMLPSKARERLAGALSSLPLPYHSNPSGPLIVMYHGIGGPDAVPVESLERQLAALKARRRVVPLVDAVRLLGHPDANGLAAISFDDGYRDFAELAVPVLSALQLHATLFVPSGWIGKTNVWDTGYATARAIMTGRELRQLDPSCVTVGAHGLTHRRLSRLDASTLYEETAVARKILEDVCGRLVLLFAYPYGQADDFDKSAESAVEAAGFLAACSTRFGRGSSPGERFRLRRVGIMPCDSIGVVERKLDGGYDWLAWKERAGAQLRGWRRLMAQSTA